MANQEIFKYFGLLAFVLLALGLSYILYTWPQPERKSFSQLIAIRRVSIVYYILLFSIVLPLLLIFFFRWFVPHVGAPMVFLAFICVASILQYLAALIPERGGHIAVHRKLASASALCMPAALVTLLFSARITWLEIGVLLIGIVSMLGIGLILISKKQETVPVTYVEQAFYYGSFLIPIMLVSYF